MTLTNDIIIDFGIFESSYRCFLSLNAMVEILPELIKSSYSKCVLLKYHWKGLSMQLFAILTLGSAQSACKFLLKNTGKIYLKDKSYLFTKFIFVPWYNRFSDCHCLHQHLSLTIISKIWAEKVDTILDESANLIYSVLLEIASHVYIDKFYHILGMFCCVNSPASWWTSEVMFKLCISTWNPANANQILKLRCNCDIFSS